MTTSNPSPGKPATLEALIALAQREHLAARLDEAAAAYRQILALRPDIAEIYNNLGSVLEQQGQLDEAVACFERASALKPGLFQAHESLGDIFHRQGKLGQAVARYRQAIALRPDLAETHNNLGSVLGQQGNLSLAAAHCERAAALKPGLFQAHNNLGNIYRQQGALEKAVASYRKTIALAPDYAEAYYNLADVLKQQGKLDESAAQYQRALALKPSLFKAHKRLGKLLQEQGKLDEALVRFEQAVALKPDRPDVHQTLGNALKLKGEFDRALASHDQSLALQPDFAEAYWTRSELKTFRAGDPDLAALEAFVAEPGRLPDDKMIFIHFALGKALEDIGDYDRAFQHLLQGNALRRREFAYDEALHLQTFKQVAETFDASLLERFAGVGDPSSAPVFVLGMPRSGSTLVEQILASHPQVHAAGELQDLTRIARYGVDSLDRSKQFPAYIAGLDANGFRRLAQAYLASLPTVAEGKLRITDKSPGNFGFVGLIRLILPNARIIHTVRNPVDTCVSCFSRLFQEVFFSYELGELGRYYRGYHELMAHFRTVLPAGVMLDVEYEQVVDNLEEQARRLIDFCGLPWDDRCLDFHKTKRPIETSSNFQVRQPLYRSSLGRWRRFEAHLGPLLAELALLPERATDHWPAASQESSS